MTKLRERFWPKVFAILLAAASGFAVCFFGISAALEMTCYGMTDETSEITWYCAVSGGYAGVIMDYYLLSQGEGSLTYLGRQALEEEGDYLATDNTNIRYRVMDMDGAAYASNADDFEAEADGDSLYQQVYTVGDICLMGQEMAEESDYFEQSSTACWLQGNSEVMSAGASQLMNLVEVLQTEFPDECDALLGGTQLEELYYTLMGDGIFLWDLKDGDTTSYLCYYLQAVVCEYYSAERYEDLALTVLNAEGFYEGNAGLLYENAALLEDAESTLTASASVGETDTDVVISVDGETASSAAISEGKTAEDYQAAVAFLSYAAALDTALDDLCSTDCYILEMGIVQNGWVTEDSVSNYVQHLVNWDTNFYGDLLATGAGALVLLLALIWLMNAAGHVKGQEGIHLCTLARCPQDVMLCLSGGAAGAIGYGALVLWTHSDIPSRFFLLDQGYTLEWNLTLSAVCGILTLAGLSLLPLVLGVTVQLKDRSLLRRTLIARILTLLWRVLRLIVRGVVRLLRAIPATWQAVELYVVFCALALVLAYVNCGGYGRIRTVAGWLLAGLLLLGLWWTVHWQSGWLRVQKGGEVLAGGDLSYQTDTAGLPKDLRRHAEHMNTVSQTMEQAVSERIKSDRFRTELITNVSHDLKTPLTSIINYVDLLKKLDLQNETARDYLDVLDRKSQRLKTLTEDLVEASKASAGVLAVNKERLDLIQLAHQAIGEYEDRLERARLEVRVQAPKEPVYVMADGRHTWRILENLLSNCTKYAMPGTRVYVDLVKKDGFAAISVKNISADPLNIPASELMERFVQGDESRSAEGSGLGLSIAQSLAKLQGADFQLAVDGDLFKASLTFPVEESPPEEALPPDEILPQ
ncbi:MAG: HAMP domain-containing histidine kinase [Clostridiales bacterium]|nr:HAMP domain-containing histidine kinase [Clostridiales bacterium]